MTLETVCQFLREVGTYYLATADGDQPRVRPFGTVLLYEGKLCIQTGKKKDVAKQIARNPKVELCACKGGEWLRVSGEMAELDDRAARVAMLDRYPELKAMYRHPLRLHRPAEDVGVLKNANNSTPPAVK